jgi:hypothetical protein
VEKLKQLLDAKRMADNMTDEEIEEVMESLIESKGQILH